MTPSNFQHMVKVAQLTATSERDRMYAENLPLVLYVCRKLFRDKPVLEESLAAGMTGLLQAVDKFDKSRGFAFSTFATRCIFNAISIEFRVRKRWQRRERQLPENAPKLAEIVGASDHDLADTFDEVAYRKQVLRSLRKHATGKDAVIVKQRLQGRTYLEIGEAIGVCKERVRQRLLRLFEKVRQDMQRKPGILAA